MKQNSEMYHRVERRDAAENRQRILDAALKLFEVHGVEQVSMNQIAIEAKIGAGTLYRRYRNKGDLCLDLIKDNIVILFEDIEAYLDAHQADSAMSRLKGVLRLFIGFREKKLELLKGMEEGVSTGSSPSRTRSPLHDELHGIFVQLLSDEFGGRLPHANHVFKADLLLMALKSDSYVFQRDVRGLSSDQFLEQLCWTFFPEA